MNKQGALAGTLVLDVSRMLPGAVLARRLLDEGARVIKIEDPRGGDPMRFASPQVGGVGAGFAAFYGGAESITLDLKSPEGGAVLRKLAKHADVLVESFRPGTLDQWDLGWNRLAALNPGLVLCSLSSYGQADQRVGHDMNFMAGSGLLDVLGSRWPRVQIADVTSGLLAMSAILSALLLRHRTGLGRHLDQPLSAGPLPFLTWHAADLAAGGGGMLEQLLAGMAPAYGRYACADGVDVVLGALEPKFWAELCEALDLPAIAGEGLETGEAGATAAAALAARFAEQPAAHWLAIAEARNLPLTAVRTVDQALGSLEPRRAGVGAEVPRLGQDNSRVLEEFGLKPVAV